jgi:hypothetical protein
MKNYKSKICSICKKEFIPNSPIQKSCSVICSEQAIKLSWKKYYKKHKLELKENKKEYRKKHHKETNKNQREYWRIHKERKKEHHRKWYLKYRANILKKNGEYYRNKLDTDINFKILCNLRGRVWHALKGTGKSKRTLDLLGCSIEKLKNHLASKFTEGMSFDNYGKWHVDHIRPCASFDLSKPEEQRKCFNYTNLQPLWAKDNLEKSDKIL